ncbi:MAG: peroxiredoxin [Steroidobacteraceae bacterium]
MNLRRPFRALLLTTALVLPTLACASPGIGAAAPAFRLQDQNEKWISLAQQQGKWVVLYFYPKDDTPGCTDEACSFRDNIFAFRKLGVTVLGISVQDVASKKQFAARNSLPFSLLADTDKSVATAYGVLNVMGVARRETFVIDPAGKIARHYPSVDPKTHSAELLKDLQTLTKG